MIVSATLRSLRSRLSGTDTQRMGAAFGGWLLAGLGLIVLLTSSTLAGAIGLIAGVAVLWLGGVWVTPFGLDAYHRSAERVLSSWIGAVDSVAAESPDEIAYYGRRALERLEDLRVPAARRESHERLVEAMASYLGALSGDDDDAVRARHAELDRELAHLEELSQAAWSGEA